jgi:hypothetical protein
MRVSLAVLGGLCLLLGLAGCCSDKCPSWQPNCCNNWDWYDPCDLVEGREARNCAPDDCAPGVVVVEHPAGCVPGPGPVPPPPPPPEVIVEPAPK